MNGALRTAGLAALLALALPLLHGCGSDSPKTGTEPESPSTTSNTTPTPSPTTPPTPPAEANRFAPGGPIADGDTGELDLIVEDGAEQAQLPALAHGHALEIRRLDAGRRLVVVQAEQRVALRHLHVPAPVPHRVGYDAESKAALTASQFGCEGVLAHETPPTTRATAAAPSVVTTAAKATATKKSTSFAFFGSA